MSATCDLAQARRLLKLVHPEQHGFVLSAVVNGGLIPHYVADPSAIERIVLELVEIQERKRAIGVYYGLAEHDSAPKNRGAEHEVSRVRCCYSDVDKPDKTTAGARIKAFVERTKLAPSILIDTGAGYQCLWLFREPFDVGPFPKGKPTPAALRVRAINAALSRELQGDATIDIARVFRLPGTRNTKCYQENYRKKGYVEPLRCRIVAVNPERYTLEDLEPLVTDADRIRAGVQATKTTTQNQANGLPLLPTRIKRASAYLSRIPGAISGDRGHAQTWIAALSIVRGFALPAEVAFDLLAREYNSRCSPPWSEKEMRHKVDDAAKAAAPQGYLLNDRRNGIPPRRHVTVLSDARKYETSSEGCVLPIIDATQRELKIITPQAWDALLRRNRPERLFRSGGVPSRIETDDDGGPVIRALTKERLRHELARAANWKATIKRGEALVAKLVQPPTLVVEDVLATPDPPLPILQRIVEAPVFSPGGVLQTKPGYHAAGKTYLMGNLDILTIPEKPSKSEIQAARDLFLIELMGEFPFVSEADRAHALALALLPYVRDMIDGPTPLHLFEAPEPGSGKSLLVDALLRSAVGRHVSMMAEARDDDEWRKRITAKLREGRAALVIDNILRPLDSGVLSTALTLLSWEDRILGKTEIVRVPVRCAWVATSNNPVLSIEIARRCIRIRLDAKQDRPWTREGFRIDNLRRWADDHRADLVRAALVLVQGWIAAGQPRHTKRLGSFETWAEVLGGILCVAEVPGFLGNLDEFYEHVDREGAKWREFVHRWWEKYTDQPVGTKELFPIAVEMDAFDLGKGSEKAQRTAFGKALGRQRDRVLSGYRVLHLGTYQRASRWQLQASGGG